MNANDISFNEDCDMYDIFINEQNDSITLNIPNTLVTARQVLKDNYKEQIAKFINSSREWYPKAYDAIKKDVGNCDGLILITIYVLFEQAQGKKRIGADSVFGLEFTLDEDSEHGRGLKIDGESFEILKYGDADVAFDEN